MSSNGITLEQLFASKDSASTAEAKATQYEKELVSAQRRALAKRQAATEAKAAYEDLRRKFEGQASAEAAAKASGSKAAKVA